jgi:hypothetical protein
MSAAEGFPIPVDDQRLTTNGQRPFSTPKRQEPREKTMPLPVIAITNASTCLTDAQVEAVLPALQKQASDDFKAYWEQDCTLQFLPKSQPLPSRWWQIVITDNPDQAGARGYHELTSQGTPLGKVFAKLDLQSGSSWTVTLSHELLEMLADPWINWCAMGSDSKIYALEVCDASRLMNSVTQLTVY